MKINLMPLLATDYWVLATKQKKSPIALDGTPFTIRRSLILTARQVFWLSDQPKESQPSHRGFVSPAVAGLRL